MSEPGQRSLLTFLSFLFGPQVLRLMDLKGGGALLQELLISFSFAMFMISFTEGSGFVLIFRRSSNS